MSRVSARWGVAVILAALWFVPVSALTIVKNGKSDYAIVLPEKPTNSLVTAANDLQKYIQQATGAKLPITAEKQTKAIYLGAVAGLDLKSVKADGFRMVVKNGCVYIAGEDTPDGKRTQEGGIANGSANGVYYFLEKYVGVRFLMPLPHGDYIPKLTKLNLPDSCDVKEEPFFLRREVPYVVDPAPEVKKWKSRQRLGVTRELVTYHNWMQVVKPELYDKHPEYFALLKGQRSRPTNRYYLVCFSNPEVEDLFVDAAVKYFKKNPNSGCFSLSPSDGNDWCECPNCSKYYEYKDGKRNTTFAVLNFYNAVARKLKKVMPGKNVAGFIYEAYVDAPQQKIELEDNVILQFAPSFDYGYTLYLPAVRGRWEKTVSGWGNRVKAMSYYDLPNSPYPNGCGGPTAPGLEILKYLYPQIADAGFWGVYVYGTHAWGHAAPTNYTLARLAWNPYLDPYQVFDEFCDKAYEKGAPAIKKMYRIIDDATKKLFIETNGAYSFYLKKEWIKAVYADHIGEIESLYAEAASKVTDPDAKVRLKYLGMNLGVLYENLRIQKLVPADRKSCLKISNDEYIKYSVMPEYSLIVFQGNIHGIGAVRDAYYKGGFNFRAAVADNKEKLSNLALRGPNEFVLRVKNDGPVTFTVKRVLDCGDNIAGLVMNSDKKLLSAGMPEKGLTFNGKKGEKYLILLNARNSSYRVNVKNANWGVAPAALHGVSFLQKKGRLYIPVPKGTKQFKLWLSSISPEEQAQAVVTTPKGRKIKFSTANTQTDQQLMQVKTGEDNGFWKMDISRIPGTCLDDFKVKAFDGVDGVVCLDPQNALL